MYVEARSHADRRRGTAVFAVRNAHSGDVLTSRRPTIAVLYNAFMKTHCAECFQPISATTAAIVASSDQRLGSPSEGKSNSARGSASSSTTTTSSASASGQQPPPLKQYATTLCECCESFALCPSCGGFTPQQRATNALWSRHALECSWLMSLPKSIRDGDTDYVRFVLRYGALSVQDAQGQGASTSSSSPPRGGSGGRRERRGSGGASAASSTGASSSSTSGGGGGGGHHHHSHHVTKDDLMSCCTNEDSQRNETKDFCVGFARLCSTQFSPHGFPISQDELYQLLLRVKVNALGFPFDAENTLGWAMEGSVFCKLNHSCAPNAALRVTSAASIVAAATTSDDDDGPSVGTSSSASSLAAAAGSSSSARAVHSSQQEAASRRKIGHMELVAIRPIVPGDEVTISYIDLQSFEGKPVERRKELAMKYRFLCQCEACEGGK